MPIDLTCPNCAADVPVTEARRSTAVECPYCAREFAAFAELGAPPPARAKPARRLNLNDDEDDDRPWKSRRGQTSGSAVMVLLVGGLGLLVVSAALGGTIYLMATDKPEAADTTPDKGKPSGPAAPRGLASTGPQAVPGTVPPGPAFASPPTAIPPGPNFHSPTIGGPPPVITVPRPPITTPGMSGVRPPPTTPVTPPTLPKTPTPRPGRIR